MSAFATNGYFALGYGTKSKGMGGGGTALPMDAMAGATNPAGGVFVGDRLDAGAAQFSPYREYSYDGPSPFFANAAQESGSTSFIIPHFGYNMMLGSDSALNIMVYGNGGMNTDYAKPVFADGSGKAKTTGVNLEQLFINTTYAINLGSLAVGASGIYVRQSFAAEGLQGFDNAFYTSSPGDVSNNGVDTSTGIGFRLGVLADVMDGITVGASYQLRTDMTPFDKYKGLFAEKGDFDIPSHYAVGMAWKAIDGLAVTLDYQQINYSEIAAIGNAGPSSSTIGPGPAPLSANMLGEDDGWGFGWEDVTVIKLGVDFTLSDTLVVRGGYNKGDNPIPDTETFLNTLAPGVITEHITAGGTFALSGSSEINFAYIIASSNSVKGDIPTEFGGGENTITMDQTEIEVSYGMKF